MGRIDSFCTLQKMSKSVNYKQGAALIWTYAAAWYVV